LLKKVGNGKNFSAKHMKLKSSLRNKPALQKRAN